MPGCAIIRGRVSRLSLMLSLLLAASAAQSQVTISGARTRNITCSAGVCSPTAATANLKISDLAVLLQSGNVSILTTAAGVQANDIIFEANLSWSSTNTLTLDAYRSVTIAKAIAATGLTAVDLLTNDGGSGGTLTFGPKGHVTFSNLASGIAINGTSYTLVGSIQQLATAVAANPAGSYALANDYNARHDRTYASAPVATTLTGAFEGLGNTISNLSISDPTNYDNVG